MHFALPDEKMTLTILADTIYRWVDCRTAIVVRKRPGALNSLIRRKDSDQNAATAGAKKLHMHWVFLIDEHYAIRDFWNRVAD